MKEDMRFSFRIWNNRNKEYIQGSGPFSEANKEYRKVCKEKFGVDPVSKMSEPASDHPARILHRKRDDPFNLFYDNPDKAQRARRRRGQF
jgi:hypothetical protein